MSKLTSSAHFKKSHEQQPLIHLLVGGELLFKISLNPHSIADDERCLFNSEITAGELPVYLDEN